MEINDLMDVLIKYKNGTNPLVDDTFESDPRKYENEYISMRDFNSSNVKAGGPKQWNIIYFPKKLYEHLPKFKQLKDNYDIRVAITPFRPINRLQLKGCAALRIYDMVSEPDKIIVNMLLSFIFS